MGQLIEAPGPVMPFIIEKKKHEIIITDLRKLKYPVILWFPVILTKMTPIKTGHINIVQSHKNMQN